MKLRQATRSLKSRALTVFLFFLPHCLICPLPNTNGFLNETRTIDGISQLNPNTLHPPFPQPLSSKGALGAQAHLGITPYLSASYPLCLQRCPPPLPPAPAQRCRSDFQMPARVMLAEIPEQESQRQDLSQSFPMSTGFRSTEFRCFPQGGEKFFHSHSHFESVS